MPRTKKVLTPGAQPEQSDSPESPSVEAHPAPSAGSPEFAQAVAAEVRRQLARVAVAPVKKGPAIVTVEEAKRAAEELVAQGRRPRAILTTDGWYCHPEMGREKQMGAKESA